jgi:hypothetical protein
MKRTPHQIRQGIVTLSRIVTEQGHSATGQAGPTILHRFHDPAIVQLVDINRPSGASLTAARLLGRSSCSRNVRILFAVCAVVVSAVLLSGTPAFAGSSFQVETGGYLCPSFDAEHPELCGVITLPGGGDVHYFFELGMSLGYGQTVPAEPGAEVSIPANEPTAMVRAKLSNLQPNTTYHYRLAVTDSEGATRFGADATFTTPAGEAATDLEVPGTTSALSTQSGSPLIVVPSTVPSVGIVISRRTLTKAQELTQALGQCKKKPRRQRWSCEKRARKRYGASSAKRVKR